MKIGAVTLAYNDEGTIAGTLKCLEPYVDRHVVMLSETPYFGEKTAPDKTEEICNKCGVDVVKGTWSLDHFQRNAGNSLMGDMDWVLGFDSDEMMTDEQINWLLNFLYVTEAEAVCLRPEVYWKTTDYVLRPIPDYAPVIAMRPHVRFTHIRNIDRNAVLSPSTMHHLSWCEPKDILKKVLNYAHATDFNGQTWYDTHYKNWKEEDKIAVLPTGSFQVERKSLPTCLKELL